MTASWPGPRRRRAPGPAWAAAVAVIAVLSAVTLMAVLHRPAAARPALSRATGSVTPSRPAGRAASASRRSAAPPAPPAGASAASGAGAGAGAGGSPYPGYDQYSNPRYGFTVLRPAAFTAQPAPGNGDGRAWAGPGGQVLLSAYGANNVLGYSARQDEAADASRLSVAYMNISGNVVTVSGYKDNGQTIVYQRDVVGPGAIDTLYWSYPADQKKRWDAVVTRTAMTFRPGDVTTGH